MFLCRDPQTIDHSAGLCTTLLPIIYDLCLAGNALKNQSETGSEVNTNKVKRAEQMLLAWSPEASCDLNSQFTHHETVAIITQANMYETAGLLVAYRLLNPLGVLDDVAIQYPKTIMTEFSTFSALAGPDTKMPFVAFPITMAAFEVPDVPTFIWDRITMLAAAPVCAAKLSNIVEYVWTERRLGFLGNIVDLIDWGPEFTTVP